MELTTEKCAEMMARNGGSLDLRGCTLPDGLTLPQIVGGSLYLSGEGWLLICESDFRKFADPWFCNELDVEDVGDASGWCAEGIREAMGLLGLSDDDSAYSRAEVHEALKRDAARIRDDRSEIALAILDRVAEMEAA